MSIFLSFINIKRLACTLKDKEEQYPTLSLSGVHTYQWMCGCEWDDETGDSCGFDEYGYDGEDFIFALDLKNIRSITPVPQGIPTVMKWNNDTTQLEFLKQYYSYECVYWLKEFLKLRKEADRITGALCSPSRSFIYIYSRDALIRFICIINHFH